MKSLPYLLILFLFISCESNIKNKDTKIVVEEGTKIPPTETNTEPIAEKNTDTENNTNAESEKSKLIGFWVGYFEKDNDSSKDGYKKNIIVDDGFQWTRNNKINISIDKIDGDQVEGHSVVAGNDRPFEGTIKEYSNPNSAYTNYEFEVKEPGDDKYDGTFKFTIQGDELKGKWSAYKNIDIKNRKYELKKRDFNYDANTMLNQNVTYVNWNKFTEEDVVGEIDDEVYEWVRREFESATRLIYKMNASNRLLEISEVENLKRGDLTIIRNTIYARHGYSFKNRPLRVFFDAQDWYIPVHADIKKDFTDIEKQNIELLLRYEKNAATYYDRFGRG